MFITLEHTTNAICFGIAGPRAVMGPGIPSRWNDASGLCAGDRLQLGGTDKCSTTINHFPAIRRKTAVQAP